MGQLDNRVALIIGAGREPGRGIARRYAREGARLLLIDRDAEALSVLQQELDARVAVADPTQREALCAAIETLTAAVGRVDILVNAALEQPVWTRLEDLTDADIDHALHQGFHAPLWAMRAVLPKMRAQGGGRVLNVGSVYGENVAEYIGGYAGAAEALRSLTRTAAQEWGRHGILVNLLMPTVDDEAFQHYRQRYAADVNTRLPLVSLQRFGDRSTP